MNQKVKELFDAASTLLDNARDLGECFVDEDCDEPEHYPEDQDGDRWYHDWWALRQAVEALSLEINQEAVDDGSLSTGL